MLLEGRSRNINARRRKPECFNIRICPTTQVLISDNSTVRENYFDSNIIYNENARLLRCFQMDYFEADVVRSHIFTSDVIKARNVHVER